MKTAEIVRLETRLGRYNLCKIKLTTVKTAPRRIGHGRNNGQRRKNKLAATIINTICSRQKVVIQNFAVNFA